MLRSLNVCFFIINLLVITPISAQVDSEGPGAPVDQIPPQLDLGQPVQQGLQLGARYVKQAYNDWDLVCLKTDQETDPCSMMQVLRDNTNNPVAEVLIFRLENGGQAVAGATIMVPLETLLTAQLTISVDGGTARRYAYSFCEQIGCVARIGLTQADVDAFRHGNLAQVSLRPAQAPEQLVTLDMSLSGFTAAYNVVDVVAN
ncbi:MAG: invasion associated locus B family protein [Rhodobacteraceae bacterium]|nr:invasion associated locus B family protein [Paracoccaceae bacterium]